MFNRLAVLQTWSVEAEFQSIGTKERLNRQRA